MKKAWILLVVALLLTGCARQDAHPEWDAGWTRFGDRMAVETPEGFAPGEYNDALSVNGIWYATWTRGEARTVTNAEGEEAEVYDAQLYLLLKECADGTEAEQNIADWAAREAQSYDSRPGSPGEPGCRTLLLQAAGEGNPYSHGAAVFWVKGELALSAELLCAERFEGDPQSILEAFLGHIHYGEQED